MDVVFVDEGAVWCNCYCCLLCCVWVLLWLCGCLGCCIFLGVCECGCSEWGEGECCCYDCGCEVFGCVFHEGSFLFSLFDGSYFSIVGSIFVSCGGCFFDVMFSGMDKSFRYVVE